MAVTFTGRAGGETEASGSENISGHKQTPRPASWPVTDSSYHRSYLFLTFLSLLFFPLLKPGLVPTTAAVNMPRDLSDGALTPGPRLTNHLAACADSRQPGGPRHSCGRPGQCGEAAPQVPAYLGLDPWRPAPLGPPTCPPGPVGATASWWLAHQPSWG